ncbi:hypothetical protein AVEN_108541-1 [Araneus ventricosus]|uniref:Uncharacterized protein n=1 Tax=Araneus ventricosus TaxID=182803 RepID=A0A4Y2M6H0_ARAVE|nr:hypothetical protein AVEN_108541-1 [Araneus ventricosus]
MSGRELPGRMNPDFSFITSMVEGTPSARGTVSPLLWWRYFALWDVLMGGSGTRGCGRTDHESCELSKHHCGSFEANRD